MGTPIPNKVGGNPLYYYDIYKMFYNRTGTYSCGSSPGPAGSLLGSYTYTGQNGDYISQYFKVSYDMDSLVSSNSTGSLTFQVWLSGTFFSGLGGSLSVGYTPSSSVTGNLSKSTISVITSGAINALGGNIGSTFDIQLRGLVNYSTGTVTFANTYIMVEGI